MSWRLRGSWEGDGGGASAGYPFLESACSVNKRWQRQGGDVKFMGEVTSTT